MQQHLRNFQLNSTLVGLHFWGVIDKPRTIERVQIESSLGFALPEPQVVGTLGSIARNHDIVCHGQHFLATMPEGAASSIFEPFSVAVEPDVINNVNPRKFPGVLVDEPGVRSLERIWECARVIKSETHLQLFAFGRDELLENTVFVSEAVTPDWQLLRCTRIEITRSKATKTTISQSCVTFLL